MTVKKKLYDSTLGPGQERGLEQQTAIKKIILTDVAKSKKNDAYDFLLFKI